MERLANENLGQRKLRVTGSNFSLIFELIEDGIVVRHSTVPIRFLLMYEDVIEKAFRYLDATVRDVRK